MLKYFESHFEEYAHQVQQNNLHPKLEKVYNRFPQNIEQLKNLIFYGPNGIGKYSQMLVAIQKYSPSELKYEKKLTLTYDKKQYFFKISDIHYEVNMSLLGCNSKLLWHEIYQQIIEILSAKNIKTGIIVCRNFQHINGELLDNFYSYMQINDPHCVCIKFILLTNALSFIPDTIIDSCEVIHISRPTKTAYNKCIGKKIQTLQNFELSNITNIKYLRSNLLELMLPHKIICDNIINEMMDIDNLKFLKFRDSIYDVFVYNLDVSECVWYILTNVLKHIKHADLNHILMKTHHFLKYYNNNYRPIYHLESYLFYLITAIYEYPTSP